MDPEMIRIFLDIRGLLTQILSELKKHSKNTK